MVALDKKIRIILVTLGLALAAMTIGVAVNLQIRNILAKNLLSQFVEQEALVADQVSGNLENNIASVREKLSLAASIPAVQGAEPSVCQPALEEIYETLESKVGNLGRVGADGFFKCSLNKDLINFPAEKLGSYMTDIFQDPQHTPVISRAIKPAGATSYLAAVHVPVYDESNEFSGTLGGAIYFSQIRDKLLKDVRFAQNGFVVLFDDNGDILYHPQDNLIGQNVYEGFARDFYDDNLRRVVTDASGAGLNDGTIRYRADNVEKIASYQKAEILPGKYWIVLVTVPVTEAEEALTVVGLDNGFMAFTLVLAVAIFSVALAATIGRLKSYEIEKAKDEFLQLTTHQLQTPITTTKYYLEILTSDYKKGLTKDQLGLIGDAFAATEQERIIVNDLLSVARLDSGRLKLKREKTDLTTLLQESVKAHELSIKKRNQSIELETDPHMQATIDPERIRMVLDNLISNASKYTPDGGSVSVRATTHGGHLRIEVADDGVGIPADKQKQLFKKFSRIQNVLSEERGGTGLGLYIAKKIVQLHSGTLKVRSVEGEGTTFTLLLKK